MGLYDKLDMLKSNIRKMESLAIAYSGGVDSTFLLAVAKEVLNEGVLAITVNSPLIPAAELKEASDFTAVREIRHEVLYVNPMSITEVKENSLERCYFCKYNVFSAIIQSAGKHGIDKIADGSNVDDESDYRPGMRALRELGVLSPLKDAAFTKNDIRNLSREMGLSTWDKPSAACLASRIPYGTELTESSLKMAELAESYLHDLGFTQVRVRCHGNIARIELLKTEQDRLLSSGLSEIINNELKRIGFKYAALDLGGYRMGSMNEGMEER